eukprot:scaffold19983_cov62-Phaeocystis_antarctica.AAC.1
MSRALQPVESRPLRVAPLTERRARPCRRMSTPRRQPWSRRTQTGSSVRPRPFSRSTMCPRPARCPSSGRLVFK